MKVRDLYEFMTDMAPLELALDWDNSGLLVGDLDQEATAAYLCLDVTDAAIDEAISLGADVIISHHPMIFHGLQSVRMDDFVGRRVLRMAAAGISYMAFHTDFDVAVMGQAVNDRLHLSDTEVLDVTACDAQGQAMGIGYIGSLRSPMRLEDLDRYVAEALGFPTAGYYGDPDRMVSRIAVCPGSGKSEADVALGRADVLITGDIGHHTGIDATAQGLSIINAGHYEVEHVFIPYVERAIGEAFLDFTVYTQELRSPLSHT